MYRLYEEELLYENLEFVFKIWYLRYSRPVNANRTAIMEGANPKLIQYGFMDKDVNASSKKKTVSCKVCRSKMNDTSSVSQQKPQRKVGECVFIY